MTMKKPSNKKLAAIRYTIVPKDLASHLFDVSVTVDLPSSEGQVFALPAWIPGSYMIREFSRNIVQIRAESQGKQVALAKLDKHSWRAAPVDGSLTLHYEVYAWDLSVRAAHLDQTHGFFNGTSVFLRVLGQEAMPHLVDIVRSPDAAAKNWRVATSLPELGAKRYGFGTYLAGDYDELIDHPVEMGEFALASFKAHGIAHDIVITGRVPNLDMKRLQGDLKAICETQIAFFEPKAKRAPMQRYVFLTLAVGDGYGGLEHRASTALICARADLPTAATPARLEANDGYLKFLGLCSHEYFHTWNVKRIKPAAFAPYDLQNETYTPLLWLFEGFTSYYDDLLALWQRFGRDFYEGGARGVTEAEVEALFDEATGLKLKPLFNRYVRGTEELPLAKLYAPFGVRLQDERKSAKPSLDVTIGRDGADSKLTQVHEGGAAHRAGMSAGDVLVALDGVRVGGAPASLDGLLNRYRVGQTVELHAFRRDELMRFDVLLQGERTPGITLEVVDGGKKAKGPLRPSAR